MNRRRTARIAPAFALLAMSLAWTAPPAAFAKDGDKKDKGAQKEDTKDKDGKDTPEGKAGAAIGADFQAKDSQRLVDRIKPKGKLRLSLGDGSDEYATEQAKGVLDEWFKDKKDIRVELTSAKDLLATLKLKFRKDGSDKDAEKTLLLTLEKKEKGGGFHLAKIEIV